MRAKRYYVNTAWTDPAEWGRIHSRKYDNDGKGYTRLEAIKICSRLTGDGKYCSVKEIRKEVSE